jgi:hypothetical protein
MDGAPSTPGQDAPSWTPDSDCGAQGTPKGRGIRAAFLLGTFLWPRKEKYLVVGGRKPPSNNLQA